MIKSTFDICVVGLGHVGLPTAVLFSESGYRVLGVDSNHARLLELAKGVSNVGEAIFDQLLIKNLRDGFLEVAEDVFAADIYIICVPTPDDPNQAKNIDLTSVFQAVDAIGAFLNKESVVVIESTCAIGSVEDIARYLSFQYFFEGHLAYCPERVLPGNAYFELTHNSRVIGATSPQAATIVKSIFAKITQGQIFTTDLKTAEFVKLAENTYRFMNICLSNELSDIAVANGIDIRKALKIANHHPRVDFASPGIGIGGHCIPVDPNFLIDDGVNTDILRAAIRFNAVRPSTIFSRIEVAYKAYAAANQRHCKIIVLGIAYKAGSGDIRNSPALEIVKKCLTLGCEIIVVDPHVAMIPGLEMTSLDEAIVETNGFFVKLVDHLEFKRSDLDIKLASSGADFTFGETPV